MPILNLACQIHWSRQVTLRLCCRTAIALVLVLACTVASAADESTEPIGTQADAYYHFSLGHLYHQLALQHMRQEYADRAVTEYKTALENDPDANIIRIELINLFAGTNQLEEAVSIADEIFTTDPDNVEVRRLLGSIYRSYATKQRQNVDLELLHKAIEQYERVSVLNSEDTDVQMALGSLYRSISEPAKAEEALQRVLAIEPENTDAQIGLAYLLMEAGRTPEAIESLEAILKEEPDNKRHLNALASAYEESGKYRLAAEVFQKLVDQDGNTLQARQRLAGNLFYSRQFEKSLEQYEKLSELDPRQADYQLQISMIERQRKNYSRAWEALEKARFLETDVVKIQFSAINLLEAEGKIEQAVKETRKLLVDTQKPEYSSSERHRRSMLQEQLGLLERKQENYEESFEAFQEIAVSTPELQPRALYQGIETWRMARDYQRAEKEARKAVNEVDGNPMLVNILATVLSERSKTKEAVKVLQGLLKNSKEDLNVLLAISRIYEKAKLFDKAIEYIDQANLLADTDSSHLNILFTYGSVYERAKEYEKSEAKFREILSIDSENSSALNYLGYMFADRSVNLDEAHDMIQRALDLEPENGAYLDSLGWVYFRQNKLELAAKYLERSLEQYQNDPIVHTHLGDVYYRQGRIKEAQHHWNQGLEEWKRSAPADRDNNEIEGLRRKLAELELSMAKDSSETKKRN